MADTLSLYAFLPHDLWIEVPFYGESAHFDKLYDNRYAGDRTFVLGICKIPGVDVDDLRHQPTDAASPCRHKVQNKRLIDDSLVFDVTSLLLLKSKVM